MSAEHLESMDAFDELFPGGEWFAAPGCVDVWVIDLAGVATSRLEALSAPERNRATRQARLRSTRSSPTFGTSRAALRAILARYLGVHAHAVEIEIGEHERPRLAPGVLPGFDFNLSHTGSRALLAVAPQRRVGIDLETVDAARDVRALAERFFTESERDRVLADADPVRAFYRLWTCKEAYLKAIGTGLSRSPRSFEVILSEGITRARASVRDGSSADEISLCELATGGERVASLCVLGGAAPLRVFDATELVS